MPLECLPQVESCCFCVKNLKAAAIYITLIFILLISVEIALVIHLGLDLSHWAAERWCKGLSKDKGDKCNVVIGCYDLYEIISLEHVDAAVMLYFMRWIYLFVLGLFWISSVFFIIFVLGMEILFLGNVYLFIIFVSICTEMVFWPLAIIRVYTAPLACTTSIGFADFPRHIVMWASYNCFWVGIYLYFVIVINSWLSELSSDGSDDSDE